jgi:hypothetical protein
MEMTKKEFCFDDCLSMGYDNVFMLYEAIQRRNLDFSWKEHSRADHQTICNLVINHSTALVQNILGTLLIMAR